MGAMSDSKTHCGSPTKVADWLEQIPLGRTERSGPAGTDAHLGFFPRASERRVLLIVGVCFIHLQTSSHLHIFSSSPLLIFTSSHLHIFSSSHLFIFTSSHLHIFSSSHLLIFTFFIFTSSHLFIFLSSHLLIFTSSHLHIFFLRIFSLLPSCPLAFLPCCSLALLHSCPLALLPSCPLLSPSFLFLSEGAGRC